MPNWKKVVVSGSNAVVNNITGSGHLNILDSGFTVNTHSSTELEVVGAISASGFNGNVSGRNITGWGDLVIQDDATIYDRANIGDRLSVGSRFSPPIASLNVYGTDSTNTGILIARGSSVGISTNDLLGAIGFDSTGSSAITVDSNNTNLPSTLLRSSVYIAGIAAETQGDSDKGGHLTFGTTALDTNANISTPERMRITSQGFVGIGETNPDQILHIKGTNPQICIEESSTEFIRIGVEETNGDMCIGWDDSDNCHFGVFSSTTDSSIITRMLIESAGNIEMYNDLTIKDGGSLESAGDTLIRLHDDSDDGVIDVYRDNTVVNRIHGNDVSYFNAGNVGIGTIVPESKLHINITDTTTNAVTNEYSDYCLALRNSTNTLNAFAGIAFDVSTETDADSIGAAIKGVCASSTSTNHDTHLTFHTNDINDDDLAERMRILNDGDVAIGATTSDARLRVVTPNNTKALSLDIGTHASFDFTANSNSGYTSTFRLNDTGMDIGHNSAARSLNLQTANLDRITITGGGRTGIGTTSPDSFVHISKTNANENILKVVGGGDNNVAMVKFIHSEASLDNNDTLLDLDFDDDVSIGTQNFFIRFQDQNGVVGGVHSEVVYGEFTAGHVSQRPSGSDFSNWKPGMIVKSTGEIINRGEGQDQNLYNAWPVIELTSNQKDKAVMGVYTYLESAPIDHINYTTSSKDVGRISGLNDDAPSIRYNSIGEGRILVTDTNGNIETGDYICSSTRLGHGEKQDDDLLHNYTVAKATQPYNFDSASIDPDLGYKSVLIACTYHCG